VYNTHVKNSARLTNLLAFVSFLVLSAVGITALLLFWNALLKPSDLGALSLPLVAITAGMAATFNPCALPALPAFLTRMSGEEAARSRHATVSLFAGLGAFALVLLLGLLVAALGEGLKPYVREHFRWAQLAVGATLILLAGLHLLEQTARLPLVGRIMDKGHQIWEWVIRSPTPEGSFAFGAGFVLVGVG